MTVITGDFSRRERKTGAVVNELVANVDGVKWSLFCAEYRGNDGKKMGFNFYALDMRDAERRIAALRATAELKGEVFGVTRA